MRRAIALRIAERGTFLPPPTAAGAAAAGAAAGAAFGAEPAAASTSFLTMRPPGPVPSMPCRSTPRSAATLRASGEDFRRSPSCALGAGAVDLAAAGSAGAATGLASCASPAPTFAAFGAALAGAFSPGSPITPMGSPTGADSPACTMIWVSTPLAKASISMATLSVSISAMGSPFVTGSPSFLSHRRILPSSMS